MAVSLGALRGMADLLPSLDRVDARRAAETVRRKLGSLQAESDRWRNLAQLIEPRLCPYLAEGATPCKSESPSAENLAERLPPEVRRTMEAAQSRGRAIRLAQEDPDMAVQTAGGIGDIYERAQVFAEIARRIAKKDRGKALELLDMALALTEPDSPTPASRRLEAITQIAAASADLSPSTFRRAVKQGLALIGEDPLEQKEQMDRLLFLRLSVRLLGFLARLEPLLAIERIRGLRDSSIRLRALLEAAENRQT